MIHDKSGKIILWSGVAVLAVVFAAQQLVADKAWLVLLDNVHWTISTSAAAAMAWLGLANSGGAERAARQWFFIGLTTYAIGQVLWDVQVSIGWNPFPAPSDLFYLTLGPGCLFGLLAAMRSLLPGHNLRVPALDAVMLSISILTLTLTIYLPRSATSDLLTLSVMTAYPVVLLSAACFGFLMVLHVHPRAGWSWMLFQVGLGLQGLVWMWWNVQTLSGSTVDGSFLNELFSVGSIVIGVSAMHWRMVPSGSKRYENWCEAVLRMLPILAVVIAALASLLVLTLDNLLPVLRETVLFASLAVVLLAALRQSLMLEEHQQLLEAERALVESSRFLQTVMDCVPAAIFWKDRSSVYLGCNKIFARDAGLAHPGEIIGKTDFDLPWTREESEAYRADDREVISSNVAKLHIVEQLHNAAGELIWLDTSKVPLTDGERSGVLGVYGDITERLAAEAKIKRLTELYAALSQCNQAIVRCSNEEELFPQICRDAVQFGGMQMAWIGLLDEASQMVQPVAWYGAGTEYLDNIQISVNADIPSGRGTTGTAIRENQPVWIQDFQNDPRLEEWHERGVLYGWGSVAALPLHRHGEVIGAFMLYSAGINTFDEPERNLLMEMAMDIDYALSSYILQAENKQAEEALRESDIRTKLVLDMAMDAVIGADQEGMVTSLNREAERMFGYSADQAIGKDIAELIVPPSYRDAHRQGMQHFVKTGNASIIGKRTEVTGMRADASEFPMELNIYAIQQRGRYIFTTFVRDITERKQAEEALRIAAAAFETQEAILITDYEAKILRVNQAFQDITGYRAEDMLGQNPRILQSGRHDADFYQAMWSTLLSTGKWSGEIWDKRKNGEIYPKSMTITAVYDNQHRVTHYVAVFRDISNRKKSEQEIHQLAFYDPLTKLPNRRLLADRLQQAIAVSVRNGWYGALLFLDLDHFKAINDTQGHAIGDMLLIEVAHRLQTCVREGDSVARLGGDEFVVVLEELSSQPDEAATQTELVAEKIRKELGQPYLLEDYECLTTPSIGVCLFLGHHESVDDLLKHADVAMYQAKAAGRNAIRFFDPSMQAILDRREELQVALRHALQREQFQLYYQIQVDSLRRPLGAEVLLRWNHPERGLVPPAEFIPLAEETGLIVPIGLWVLQTACAQLKEWQRDARTCELRLAVNVSAKQFRQPDFVEQVQRVLLESAAMSSHLKLELTESTVLENVQDTIVKMRELRLLGVSFSMDDFGTGYSSLQYLKQLPLDQLKIDQSFVRDIASDPNDAAIVQTIIAMTEALALNVIAEGVETTAQYQFLDTHGCHSFQGYLFSKPLPLQQFEALLIQGGTISVG